jgi:hypothetical protein
MKPLQMTGATAILFALLPMSGYCADLAGTVTDRMGQPVQGVQLILEDGSGKAWARQSTDSSGHYNFKEVAPGDYECVLDPTGTHLKGGSAATKIEAEGTTLDWKVSDSLVAAGTPAVGFSAAANGGPGVPAAGGGVAGTNGTNGGAGAADPLFVHSGPVGNPVGGPPNHGLGSGSSSQ